MKKTDIQQLKNKQAPELQKKLLEAYGELRNLKFDLSQGKVKNIKLVKEAKKLIARILTEINSK